MTEAQLNKYKELTESGQLKKVREKIYWLIKEYQPISTNDIQAITGIKRNGTIGGRLAELHDRGKITTTNTVNSVSIWRTTTEVEQERIKRERQTEKENRAVNLLLNSSNVSKAGKLALVKAWQDINGLKDSDLSEQDKQRIVDEFKTDLTVKEIKEWLSDFDNLYDTGHFIDVNIDEYVFYHKGKKLKQFLSIGREIIRKTFIKKNGK